MIEKLLLYSSLFAAGVIVCGMLGCLVPIIGKLKWTKSPLLGLPSSTRITLLLLAVGLTFVGATKTNRANGVSSSLVTNSQVSRVGNRSVSSTNALEQTSGSLTDTERFLDIAVATNGTVSLIAHRPSEASTAQQNIVVVATTNLCTPTWFALTNTAFAVGETNLSVALARSFLLFNSISNLGIFAFCEAGDSDDDGLDDWHERYNLKTDPTLVDSDGDGLADGAEVTHGTNPRLRDTDGDGYGDAGDPDPCAATSWADSNGDGWPDAWVNFWFGGSVPGWASPDAIGPGGWSFESLLMLGLDPAAATNTTDIVSQVHPRIFAHTIISAGFSFSRTNNVYGAQVTNILARTIPVVRTNRWVQCFVSSRPDCAAGWTARDIALEHGVDGVFDYHSSALPLESDDSVRIDFPEHSATSVAFTVQATGAEPMLSRPLYLLEWAPRILFERSISNLLVTALARNSQLQGYAVRPSSEYDAYLLPFSFDQGVATVYDARGRVVRMDGDTTPLTFAYDSCGRKTASRTTRDEGVAWDETAWQYDFSTGLNTNKVYADGSHVRHDYTANGRRTRTTWARGAWREHAYNDRNLESGTTYSGADTPSVVYTYADSGRLARATLGDGTTYVYADDDRLLNTNETVTIGSDVFEVRRSHDDFSRIGTTFCAFQNHAYSASTRHYDDENRLCGYTLANLTGHTLPIMFAFDGAQLTNMVYTLPNANVLSVRLMLEAARRELVTQRAYTINGQPIYSYSTEYDLIGRPTNAVDSVSIARNWLYNRRSELVGATIGTNRYDYAYDSIGNRQWASVNAVTNVYSANCLNQYMSIVQRNASPIEPLYDADGNLTNDCAFAYSYDAENRLVSAYPLAPVAGSLAVENAYDHRHRRVRKTVKAFNGSVWSVAETHAFVWDENNIVLETVSTSTGICRVIEYFWGPDKSGTEQGAGGVGGLLAVSENGEFYIPCYDHNGNIVCYVSGNGSIAAEYVYDPYGNIIETRGTMPDAFNFGFSTKYHDREIGIVSYQRRFYRPDLGRWLNRDPNAEDGGVNLYVFCGNVPVVNVDTNGCAFFAYRSLDVPIIGRRFGVHGNTYYARKSHRVMAHEHLFFEDGKSPVNIGYGDKGVFLENNLTGYLSAHSSGWNDCLMREAVNRVKPRPYKMWGSNQYNCQDYAEDLRIMFMKLVHDDNLRKKCLCGSLAK